jgi:hypothetical protein
MKAGKRFVPPKKYRLGANDSGNAIYHGVTAADVASALKVKPRNGPVKILTREEIEALGLTKR